MVTNGHACPGQPLELTMVFDGLPFQYAETCFNVLGAFGAARWDERVWFHGYVEAATWARRVRRPLHLDRR